MPFDDSSYLVFLYEKIVPQEKIIFLVAAVVAGIVSCFVTGVVRCLIGCIVCCFVASFIGCFVCAVTGFLFYGC